jgi:DNA (cytosine-5)-methyltransferase 1
VRLRVEKIRRLRAGHAPRVLDLFSGCGGISLGFHAEGYQPVAAVELDPIASSTHGLNFFRGAGPEELERHQRARDITTVGPTDLCAEYGWDHPATAVDVVTGGPPCQAYARVGRAKLREIAEHPTAFLRDARSNLYLRFLTYVEAFQPLAILMENVPDALNFGGHNIAEETCEALEVLGYRAKYTLLNSANYGVPQMRERMFLIAYAEELQADISFPLPSHWVELPRGYEGTRRVALRNVSPTLFEDATRYVRPPSARRELPPAITAKEALEDLPLITTHLTGELRRGARRFTELVHYRSDIKPSPFARAMRCWPQFESVGGVKDHAIRSLPRDYAIFREMKAGDQYPEAYQVAERLFDKKLRQLARAGRIISPRSKEYERLRTSIVPPYDATKFPNKWRKMEPDQPARTLMAHLGKDSYSHIHYDSSQARTISVREAARLQSFPDGFVFCGTMNPAFRQIGNAVPPLMARALASVMRAVLLTETPEHEQAGTKEAYSLGSHAL